MRTTVVGYVRVSTERQADEGISLDAQRAKLAAYAVAMDLDLVCIVEDAGLSAKSLDRPGLARALAMLDAGEAQGIVVTKLDRLTRSVRDLGDLVERYFASRFSLLSVSDSIDTRTATGRLVLNVLASVSQWEREATAERTRDALAHVKANGGKIGRDGLGWTRTADTDANGRRVVAEDTEEQETLRRMLQLRATGASVREIAVALTAEGRPTKRGGAWSAGTVQKILARAA
jgi:DNA invertase Pin-like site-specific DNA recombinase